MNPTNENRSQTAQVAVAAFATATNTDIEAEGLEVVMTELVTNLMHLCTQNGIKFDSVVSMAEMHFESEAATGDDQATPVQRTFGSEEEKVAALASEFSRVLRDWLTEDEMFEVLARNAQETNEGICHSHDFCDANMAMDEASRNLGLAELFDHDGSEQAVENACSIWNQAWEIARKSCFSGDAPLL